MTRILTMAAATAALLFAPAAFAAETGEEGHVESVGPASADQSAPVRLVSWDGDFELLKTSRRLRIWRSHLAYRMTVDAEGNVTSCELTETFRRTYVNDKICEILSAHHTFEPALDDEGTAVEGTYTSRLSYMEMRERQ